MRWILPALALVLPDGAGQAADPVVMPGAGTRPARIDPDELAGFSQLPSARRKLLETALAQAWDSPWLPYLAGGADPQDGGFDGSGAMYFVLRKADPGPPRGSAARMKWLAENGGPHDVAANTGPAARARRACG